MGNAYLTITKEYADDLDWTEAKMDAIKASIEAWADIVNNNLDQLKADILPSGYAYDDDGAGNLTNKIYDKQTATDTYESNLALGTSTDADWADVDATEAKLTFTPEYAGDFFVTFQFNWEVIPTGGNAADVDVQFRLIDDDDNVSTGIICQFDPVSADEPTIRPVTIQHIFTFTAAAHSVKLQKKVTTASNLGTHQLKGSTSNYGLSMMARKI